MVLVQVLSNSVDYDPPLVSAKLSLVLMAARDQNLVQKLVLWTEEENLMRAWLFSLSTSQFEPSSFYFVLSPLFSQGNICHWTQGEVLNGLCVSFVIVWFKFLCSGGCKAMSAELLGLRVSKVFAMAVDFLLSISICRVAFFRSWSVASPSGDCAVISSSFRAIW